MTSMRSQSLRKALLGLGVLALVAEAVVACSVPVFRYALERWSPDSYRATVFHQGPLEEEQTRNVERLRASDANLEVVLVDLAVESEASVLEIWEEQRSETLPWLYVTYPEAHPVAIELASGPLGDPLMGAVLDSSVRREIGNRLVAGESAVWVLLESGDAARDEAAWKLLNAELARLEEELELPMIEQEDIDAGLLALDENELKIVFSSLRVNRDKPADEMFVRMLLDTEDDLIDRNDPIVFPVFGRGRVLYGLAGGGIVSETIKAAAAYLVGSCSCQVKADNPGVDLLMAVNWNALVESTLDHEQELPELAGIMPPAKPGEVSEELPAATLPIRASGNDAPGESTVASAGESRQMLWTTLAVLVTMLVAVALGGAFLSTKKV